MSHTEDVEVGAAGIRLGQLLKYVNAVETGGEVKDLLASRRGPRQRRGRAPAAAPSCRRRRRHRPRRHLPPHLGPRVTARSGAMGHPNAHFGISRQDRKWSWPPRPVAGTPSTSTDASPALTRPIATKPSGSGHTGRERRQQRVVLSPAQHPLERVGVERRGRVGERLADLERRGVDRAGPRRTPWPRGPRPAAARPTRRPSRWRPRPQRPGLRRTAAPAPCAPRPAPAASGIPAPARRGRPRTSRAAPPRPARRRAAPLTA